jgi:hypothetical protein
MAGVLECDAERQVMQPSARLDAYEQLGHVPHAACEGRRAHGERRIVGEDFPIVLEV